MQLIAVAGKRVELIDAGLALRITCDHIIANTQHIKTRSVMRCYDGTRWTFLKLTPQQAQFSTFLHTSYEAKTMTQITSRTTCKFVLAAFAAALAFPMMAPPADAAKGKKAQRSATYKSAPVSRSSDTYYYGGLRQVGIRDRARPYFGSPVRGVEFFEAQRHD